MSILERSWELVTDLFTGLTGGIERSVTGLFGSSNARYIRRLAPKVQAINALEPKYQAMTDEELREQTRQFQQRLDAGETLDGLLVEAFAVCREGGRRFLGMRHYDVQLLGGMVLHSGAIAEMVTGEGKTLVATLPAYLNALAGRGVHVVTVNDYLARRDMEWMGPIYTGLGLTVGAIQSDMDAELRQKSYQCDITYGTNNEFGFDYLRDNMRMAARGDRRYPPHIQQSQGPLNFAIIDEVDNILIDEARTPLIISGPTDNNPRKYAEADRIARQLTPNTDFEVNEKDHNVHLTDAGVRKAERLAGVESFYTTGNMDWPHMIDNALKANYLYKRDVNYVVKEGRVVIVDEFTGRLMEGRQWSDGLHQAVEAKEGVRIKEETQTLATITLQNFFKLYEKISGMTGTAMTESSEFWKIYKLEVIAIPTNREMQRIESPDLIFCTEEEKYEAIAKEIERLNKWDSIRLKDGNIVWGTLHSEDEVKIVFTARESKEKKEFNRSEVYELEKRGRPILVGTTSIEKSELLSAMLERKNIPHQVLNAKHHRREAEIIAQAGRRGAVTIATNMAGRGTDIILGGNPETLAWAVLQDKYATRLDVPRAEWDALVHDIEARERMKEEGKQVKELGGLHVIGTERHEARRIDLQLRGRCGRQGDPGSSRFYLSLRDDLMRIFAGPWVEKALKSLGLPEGEAIESRMVTRRIEAAQKKVEERNFEIRKNLLEYDEVMDEQRKRVYSYRQRLLDGASCKTMVLEMIERQVREMTANFYQADYGHSTFAAFASSRLNNTIEARDIKGLAFPQAEEYAKNQSCRMAETQIHDAIEENLPLEEEPSDWNWSALSAFAQTRWGIKVSDREIKQVGRDHLAEFLMEKSHAAIHAVDLDEGAQYLDPDFHLRALASWFVHKFQVQVPLEKLQSLDKDAATSFLITVAQQEYGHREQTLPVNIAMNSFAKRSAEGIVTINRRALLNWVNGRFEKDLPEDAFDSLSTEAIRAQLLKFCEENKAKGESLRAESLEKLQAIFETGDDQATPISLGVVDRVQSFLDWASERFVPDIDHRKAVRTSRKDLQLAILNAIDDRFHPEIRRIERELILQILDGAWKDHLLTMDHLRSGIGLVGYAQVDPKVEYKREGMRMFEQVWKSIADRITDLMFRVDSANEGSPRANTLWKETSARHDSAQSPTQLAADQQAALDASQGGGDGKVETVRNRGAHVGRNDPCPCGSGKKFKNCCMGKK
jgi:preprotein translocase subunit SecA